MLTTRQNSKSNNWCHAIQKIECKRRRKNKKKLQQQQQLTTCYYKSHNTNYKSHMAYTSIALHRTMVAAAVAAGSITIYRVNSQSKWFSQTTTIFDFLRVNRVNIFLFAINSWQPCARLCVSALFTHTYIYVCTFDILYGCIWALYLIEKIADHHRNVLYAIIASKLCARQPN